MGLRSDMNLKLTLCLWEDTVGRKCFVLGQRMWNFEQI